MITISVKNSDILNSYCDVLLLKHADGFYGVDEVVSRKVGFSGSIPNGDHIFLHGKNIEARKVLYLGVGELGDFRYEHIREFGKRALNVLSKGSGSSAIVASPLHGPGYGLDEKEAFLSLIAGFTDAIEDGSYPSDLQDIQIVEKQESRFQRLSKILSQYLNKTNTTEEHSPASRNSSFIIDNKIRTHDDLSSYGTESENKPKMFVAMPFKDDFFDEYNISIKEAVNNAGILCERLDEQSYTGDILSQIKKRIENSAGLLALLNDSNANVFLEVGYAWAKDKPTVLIIKQGLSLPFDVAGQKCIVYKNLTDLRNKLTDELTSLVKNNVVTLDKRRKY